MNRARRAAIVAAFLLGLAGRDDAARAADAPSAFGFWLNPDQGWVVETAPCGDALCGTLVGFRKTVSAEYVARDQHNPDPKRRGDPLCGLQLLGGFKPAPGAAGVWDHGWVYDPDTGNTYTGVAQLIDADTVELRGYILIPLFGRTLTLIRESGAVTRCTRPPNG